MRGRKWVMLVHVQHLSGGHIQYWFGSSHVICWQQGKYRISTIVSLKMIIITILHNIGVVPRDRQIIRQSNLFESVLLLSHNVLNHHGYWVNPGDHHAQRHHMLNHKQKTEKNQQQYRVSVKYKIHTCVTPITYIHLTRITPFL